MLSRSLRRSLLAVLIGGYAPCVPHRALALTRGICATGPQAVTCDWCPDAAHCSSAGSVGVGSNRPVQHPEIVLLFWQDQSDHGYEWEAWSPYQNTPTQGQLIGSALGLVNGPYYASLSQYGPLVARPHMSAFAPIVTGAPDASPPGTSTTSFQDTDLEYLVNQEIAGGLAPPPVAGDDVLYVVMLPGTSPGTSTGGNASCYHDHAGCSYSWGSFDGVPYTFAYVVAGPGASTSISRVTVDAIAAHGDIRVEGCRYQSGGAPADQIGDLCRCATEQWASGVSMQAYWSVADEACVIPESWGQLSYDRTGAGGVWETTAYYPRQAYGGADGVVFTDTSDDAWFFDSDDGQFTQFGGPGAQFAVGTASDGSGRTVIAGLTTDTLYGVNYYDTGSKQWYGAGAPNGPATSLTVTAQGILVATDTYGQPWYYVPADRPHARWVNFGGPGDQFIAVGKEIYALNPGRDSVFVWPWQNFDAGGRWTQIRRSASYLQIVASPDGIDWGTYVPGQATFWQSGTDDGPLVDAYDFAVSGLVSATFVAGGQTVQVRTSDLGATWNAIGQDPVGRLVSGNLVYATRCPGNPPCVVLGE